jgi:hypothetical protein
VRRVQWQRSAGGVLGYGMATTLPGRALGVHQAAVARAQEGASRVTTTVRAHVAVWPCFAARLLLGCAAQPRATSCGMGVHLGGHGGRQRLWGQNELADPSDDCLGASGGGGLRLRGVPRTGRPALSPQASADRPARSPRRCTDSGRRRRRICFVLRLAALVQELGGVPDGRAAQAPPVVLPVGPVLGVGVEHVGARGHAEPAGVAVLALPSVGHKAMLIREHAAAQQRPKTLMPWKVSPYYDRIMQRSSPFSSAPATKTNRLMGQTASSSSSSF